MEKVKAIKIMRLTALLAVISGSPMSLFPLSFPTAKNQLPPAAKDSVAAPRTDSLAARQTTRIDSLLAYYDSIENAIEAKKQLGEVVVTARESRGVTSSSVIDRQAMAHLQPSSFSDLLELLPGHISADPQMGQANLISLREASQPSSDYYSTSSLGTSFVIDGVPVNTSAELQRTPVSDYAGRLSTGKGVDMRSLSTDDIESVEVIRGIPSAEYGEVTSGVVNIRRKSGVTGLEARFKADMQSQLFYVGKGFALNKNAAGASTAGNAAGNAAGNHILNLSADYLDSRIDPRNARDNFRRVNLSARGNFSFRSPRFATTLTTSLTYTGTFERDFNDPDLTVNNTIDKYRQDRNALSWQGVLNLRALKSPVFSGLTLTAGLSYADEHLAQQRTVASSRIYPMPVSTKPGSWNVGFLPMLYLADYDVYGKPLTACVKATTRLRLNFGKFENQLRAGAEWNFSKNLGRGEVYDLERPLVAGNTSRPRPFRDVPAMNQLSAYAELVTEVTVAEQRLQLQAGVRETQLLGLPTDYYLHLRPYFDPRVNLKYTSSPVAMFGEYVTFEAAGGFGWHTKMPVSAYLYPDPKYTDFVQLNYYHNDEQYRVVNVRTFVDDLANPGLKAARNFKWEVRGDIFCNGNRLSVTYFREKMTDAFRMAPELRLYEYLLYDATGYDPAAPGAKPLPEGLPATVEKRVNLLSKPSNSSSIRKEGIEFSLSSRRFPRLHTRLTVNGAWFRTTFANSGPLWYKPSIIVNNKELQYVGLYDDRDGHVSQSFNANLTLDTDLPRLGLNLSLTMQNVWFTSTRQLRRSGIPMGYVGEDMVYHVWDPADSSDPYLSQLIRRYSPSAFDENRIPYASNFNLKATKKLLNDKLMIALFVNRIISITPDYELYGVVHRRYSSPYFGMELNLKL